MGVEERGNGQIGEQAAMLRGTKLDAQLTQQRNMVTL